MSVPEQSLITEEHRATIGQKVMGSRLYKAVTGSQLYNYYRLFRPE